MADASGRRALGRVLAVTQPENRASIRLLERLSFRYGRPVRLDEDGPELALYSALTHPVPARSDKTGRLAVFRSDAPGLQVSFPKIFRPSCSGMHHDLSPELIRGASPGKPGAAAPGQLTSGHVGGGPEATILEANVLSDPGHQDHGNR
jgi:hypothetical protein